MPTSSRGDVATLVTAAIKRIRFGWEVTSVTEYADRDRGVTGVDTKMAKRSPMPGRFEVRAMSHRVAHVTFVLSTNHRDPPHQPIEVRLGRDINEEAEHPPILYRFLRQLAMDAWLHEFDEWWLVDGQRQDPHDHDDEPAPFGFPLHLKF